MAPSSEANPDPIFDFGRTSFSWFTLGVGVVMAIVPLLDGHDNSTSEWLLFALWFALVTGAAAYLATPKSLRLSKSGGELLLGRSKTRFRWSDVKSLHLELHQVRGQLRPSYHFRVVLESGRRLFFTVDSTEVERLTSAVVACCSHVMLVDDRRSLIHR